MAIEEKYETIIKELQARPEVITEWEVGFVDSCAGRSYLSYKQKAVLDRLATEKLQGGTYDKDNLDYGAMSAGKTDSGWLVTIGGKPVGTKITKKEAALITRWLHEAIDSILRLPDYAFDDSIKNQDEVPRDIAEFAGDDKQDEPPF